MKHLQCLHRLHARFSSVFFVSPAIFCGDVFSTFDFVQFVGFRRWNMFFVPIFCCGNSKCWREKCWDLVGNEETYHILLCNIASYFRILALRFLHLSSLWNRRVSWLIFHVWIMGKYRWGKIVFPHGNARQWNEWLSPADARGSTQLLWKSERDMYACYRSVLPKSKWPNLPAQIRMSSSCT